MTAANAEVSIIPVSTGDQQVKLDASKLPDTLPLLALRNAVLFPGTIYPITIGRAKSLQLVDEAQKSGCYIAAIPQLDVNEEDPSSEKSFSKYGVVARVIKTFEMPDGSVSAVLQGYSRVELLRITDTAPYLRAAVAYLSDIEVDASDSSIKVLAESLKEKAAAILRGSSFVPKEAVNALLSIDNFDFLVNFISTTIDIEDMKEKVGLLCYGDMHERAMALLTALDKQVQLLKIKQEINSKVRNEIDQQQREYYLNNQLRTIQEELGMDDDEDVAKLREAAKKKVWKEEVAAAFEKELGKLEKFNPSSPEYSIQYNYLQFMLELPWDETTKDNLDLSHAQKVLDHDHYGLEKVKDRIIEFLAVLKLNGKMKSPIVCLYGPPGVGKTSLGKSIAKSLGRKYVRISLGGMHDEAEIRGHRKTYVGALPGRILNGIARAGASNPVMVLDEIDKMSGDFKGDPSSALLEVLDPEQNTTFHDNYLDMDYDLSKVLFITTANTLNGIQPALLDRMELINVTGYLAEEKMEIAKKFLLPKQLKEAGLKKSQLHVGDEAMESIIAEYTQESGVRGLEKEIAKLCRVTAKKIALGEKHPTTIRKEHLHEYLGLPKAFHDKMAGNEFPGVVTGLAWTEVGGEILFIESSVSKGKGNLSMTGNLGDVMKESAQIGWQYIKAHPEVAGLTGEEFMARDIHVHVPEGAVPKDGPSAGITMVVSMVSGLRGEAIKSGIAMTGEMTLRGKVLPVGGIKEKILAAKRAGAKTIVISEENRKDVEEVGEKYTAGLEFHYVSTISDVLSFVFD